MSGINIPIEQLEQTAKEAYERLIGITSEENAYIDISKINLDALNPILEQAKKAATNLDNALKAAPRESDAYLGERGGYSDPKNSDREVTLLKLNRQIEKVDFAILYREKVTKAGIVDTSSESLTTAQAALDALNISPDARLNKENIEDSKVYAAKQALATLETELAGALPIGGSNNPRHEPEFSALYYQKSQVVGSLRYNLARVADAQAGKADPYYESLEGFNALLASNHPSLSAEKKKEISRTAAQFRVVEDPSSKEFDNEAILKLLVKDSNFNETGQIRQALQGKKQPTISREPSATSTGSSTISDSDPLGSLKKYLEKKGMLPEQQDQRERFERLIGPLIKQNENPITLMPRIERASTGDLQLSSPFKTDSLREPYFNMRKVLMDLYVEKAMMNLATFGLNPNQVMFATNHWLHDSFTSSALSNSNFDPFVKLQQDSAKYIALAMMQYYHLEQQMQGIALANYCVTSNKQYDLSDVVAAVMRGDPKKLNSDTDILQIVAAYKTAMQSAQIAGLSPPQQAKVAAFIISAESASDISLRNLPNVINAVSSLSSEALKAASNEFLATLITTTLLAQQQQAAMPNRQV